MSNLLRPTMVVRDEPPARPLPELSVKPQLLWPSIKYEKDIENQDAPFFPDTQDVCGRHTASKADTILKLIAFESAVVQAEMHILVLDPHFDKIGAKVIGPALEFSQARDVRLLTGGGDVSEEEREGLRKKFTDYRNLNRVDGRQVAIQWSATLDKSTFPFLHDRFAIVDGALWHFGSTVGGGHQGLTAASGPWSATRTHAKEFFEECWRKCNARSVTRSE